MKIEIADLNEVIKVNDLQEITNPTYFEFKGIPTREGLFSFEIFGRPGSDDRKTVFAYIDLLDWYLHPLAYKTLSRLNRKFEECLAGISQFKIDQSGELVKADNEEEKGVGSGLKWLYTHWEQLNFRKTASQDRDQRVKMLMKVPKNVLWQNKQLVIPAFYRDINFEKLEMNIIGRDEINEKYAHLLRLLTNVKFNRDFDNGNSDSEDVMLNNSRMMIQKILNDSYAYFTQKLEKKDGLFHKGLMGKSLDYAGLSVITSPQINQSTYEDMPVNFFQVGVPLYQISCLFYPFFLKWISDFIKAEVQEKNSAIGAVSGKQIRINMNKSLDLYSENELYKRIKAFEKSPNSRFDLIKLVLEDGTEANVFFSGKMYNPFTKQYDSDIKDRFFTWTDLLYMAAIDITRDKYLYITRYPVTSNLSIYATGIFVKSTLKTCKMVIEGKEYPYYPVIDLTTPYEMVQSKFTDTISMFNGHLKALGGDYDGDTVIIRGCFTQEANAEAKRMLYSKSNILDVTGNNIRKTERDAIATLYSLTMEPPK